MYRKTFEIYKCEFNGKNELQIFLTGAQLMMVPRNRLEYQCAHYTIQQLLYWLLVGDRVEQHLAVLDRLWKWPCCTE